LVLDPVSGLVWQWVQQSRGVALVFLTRHVTALTVSQETCRYNAGYSFGFRQTLQTKLVYKITLGRLSSIVLFEKLIVP
jgi:hypothetical protein